MNIENLLELLKDKPVYNFMWSVAYMTSFEIGEPRLKCKEKIKPHNLFKHERNKKLLFPQKYYSCHIKGEISFFIDSYWNVVFDDKIVFDPDDFEYAEDIEYDLDFVLRGHSIIDIIMDKEHQINIIFSNNMKLICFDSDDEKGSLCFFIYINGGKHTFNLGNDFGYKCYPCDIHGDDVEWISF